MRKFTKGGQVRNADKKTGERTIVEGGKSRGNENHEGDHLVMSHKEGWSDRQDQDELSAGESPRDAGASSFQRRQNSGLRRNECSAIRFTVEDLLSTGREMNKNISQKKGECLAKRGA